MLRLPTLVQVEDGRQYAAIVFAGVATTSELLVVDMSEVSTGCLHVLAMQRRVAREHGVASCGDAADGVQLGRKNLRHETVDVLEHGLQFWHCCRGLTVLRNGASGDASRGRVLGVHPQNGVSAREAPTALHHAGGHRAARPGPLRSSSHCLRCFRGEEVVQDAVAVFTQHGNSGLRPLACTPPPTNYAPLCSQSESLEARGDAACPLGCRSAEEAPVFPGIKVPPFGSQQRHGVVPGVPLPHGADTGGIQSQGLRLEAAQQPAIRQQREDAAEAGLLALHWQLAPLPHRAEQLDVGCPKTLGAEILEPHGGLLRAVVSQQHARRPSQLVAGGGRQGDPSHEVHPAPHTSAPAGAQQQQTTA
mmetsp:Transcript_64643/g.163699  ORF Transcript_64643/g.163699 Transcript_64643/m.163699 type:complete len:362 (-) Transcript_64643:343-1428(-)